MRLRLYIYLLIIIGLVVYLNALPNKFIGDDVDQIVRNPLIHSVKNILTYFTGSTYGSGGSENRLVGLYYRPIMMSVYALIYSVAGTDALYYHLVQIVLHIIVVIMVFFFFKRFVNTILAFFGASVFLVHPINVETVGYIADIQDVLFVLSGMGALLLARYQSNFKKYKVLYLVLLFITLLFSLLSKETGILFFPILIFYLWLIEKKPIQTILRHGFIMLAVIGFYLYFRFGVAHMSTAQTSLAPITSASFFQRIVHIPLIIQTYLLTFFWPSLLRSSQYWFFSQYNWESFYRPLILVSLAFGAFIYFGLRLRGESFLNYIRKFITVKGLQETFNRDNSIAYSYYLFFFIWFALGLSFHLQLYPLDMTVAERWFYFPEIGLIGLLIIALSTLKIYSLRVKRARYIAMAVIIVALSIRTYYRNQDWRDALSLYSKDLQGVKGNFILENALGTEYITRGEIKKAKPYIISSVTTRPFFANLNNLAIIQLEEGQVVEAKKTLIRAIDDGENYYIYENFANFLLVYGEPKEAKIFAEHALKTFPNNARLWIALAQAEYFLKNNEKAIKAAEKAVYLSNNEKVRDIYERIKQGLPIIQVR